MYTTAITELLTALEGAGVFATMDPARVNLPGGWLAVDEVAAVNLKGALELRCSLFLIVKDRDTLRATEALAELYATTCTVLRPDGPVVTQGVVLPDSPTPMPALRVPIHLHTESE
jgi:hypothetical protein